MAGRTWTHGEGPRRHRVRLFQDPEFSGGNIQVEIRDARRPGEERYRTLSLGHRDQERATRFARLMVRWWLRTGMPPRIVWRRQVRGPRPKGCARQVRREGAGDIADKSWPRPPLIAPRGSKITGGTDQGASVEG